MLPITAFYTQRTLWDCHTDKHLDCAWILINMKIWGRDIEINYLKQSENVKNDIQIHIQKHTYAYHKGNTMTMKFADNFPNPQNKKEI